MGVVLGQNLGQISKDVKKVKKWAFSIVFSFFTWGIPFKANIVRIATFEGHSGQMFAQFWSTMAKNCLFSRI